ncbi:MAG: hypothetical protein GX331_00655 [Firmicutes bacterium]|nr:hypothetical protein [Bacillota bacterium]
MRTIFQKPEALTDTQFHYCPGCTHGIIHRLVAHALDTLGIRKETIGVASVGCSVFAYEYFNCDMQQAAHGRAPAVATGIKRVLPERIVFTYQGDGDLASIGMGEIIHAAARGENITVIFVNNAIYGMTSGQMAPTTLIGQKTATSPRGRSSSETGYPIRMCELLSTLHGPSYIARVSTHDPRHILQAEKAIRRAFEMQQQKRGFSMVEILSTCSVNWGMTPAESMGWLADNMIPYYPLGVFKEAENEGGRLNE